MRIAVQSSGVVWMLGAVLCAGCAGARDESEDEAGEGYVTSSALSLSAASEELSFREFTDPLGAPAADRSVRRLITSAAEYSRALKHAPPSGLDFKREVVVYYSAGTRNTGGYEASILSVTRLGSMLQVVTSLEAPGPDCKVTQSLTHPFVLVRIPVRRPIYLADFDREDNVRDCAGEPACGGSAGTRCPPASGCVDDPGDSCDPNSGGTNCAGLCRCLQIALCIQGFVFDASPEVCACVPNPNADPCDAVRCGSGRHCEAVAGGSTRCVPNEPDVICGGIAGIKCAGLGRCADDTRDSCDPARGGVDCPGVCTCMPTFLCQQGRSFDNSPSVCSCVIDP